jgi:two-component system sensor histidine kinase DegS
VDLLNNPPEGEAEDFGTFIENELDLARRSLNEVTMMLEQSQAELSKLTQRNAAITGHLQQVQAQFETLPRADIKMAYNHALDAQQRLLVMRGQLEKLQSDQENMKRYIIILEKADVILSHSSSSGGGGRVTGNRAAIVEMVINAQESVRQRLSRQMHDGPAQALSNFIVQTEIATKLFDIDQTRAKEELNNLKTSALNTFQKIRGYIFELRPMMLDDLGLIPTLRRYCEGFKEQSGTDLGFSVRGQERRLQSYLEVTVFRAVQELLGNAVRHNQDQPVKVQIGVQILMEETLIRVIVSDNGIGFDPMAMSSGDGLGLKLLKERVDMLGGFFEIDSAPGQGSKITFEVPSLELVA